MGTVHVWFEPGTRAQIGNGRYVCISRLAFDGRGDEEVYLLRLAPEADDLIDDILSIGMVKLAYLETLGLVLPLGPEDDADRVAPTPTPAPLDADVRAPEDEDELIPA